MPRSAVCSLRSHAERSAWSLRIFSRSAPTSVTWSKFSPGEPIAAALAGGAGELTPGPFVALTGVVALFVSSTGGWSAAFVALVGVLASIAARPADGATNSTEDRSEA